MLAQINSVANMDGKGRDDLGYEILFEAEGIIRRVTKEQSKAVRNLAESIKRRYRITVIGTLPTSFQKFRDLMKKYEENIEMVDPQLKNNQDLIEVLQEYEVQWEKGLNYFLDAKKCNQLIFFSHIIETTGEKHKVHAHQCIDYLQTFQEQIEYRDADIFVAIPCLIVLKHLENEDKNICSYFLPTMDDPSSKQYQLFQQLRTEFDQWRQTHQASYEYYNILEKALLGLPLEAAEREAA